MNSLNILSDEYLYKFLTNKCPPPPKYWLACSGGLDSCVLLHLFFLNKKRIKQDIGVIYVNHKLQKESKSWGSFCEKLCEIYNIDFLSLEITSLCPSKKSIEEWARDERYRLIKEQLVDNDILLTAHHLDDQVETFFLQALRGSGINGLSCMPYIKPFGSSYHVRPLLNFSRKELLQYAKTYSLDWCEDSSNLDVRFNRNYIRKLILPNIESRWPSYRKTISRLIGHQQELKLLLDEVAKEDINKTCDTKSMGIDISLIRKLSLPRKKNLIMLWIKQQKFKLPSSTHLARIISDIIDSSADKNPYVNWNGVEIRRYKNTMYAIEPFTTNSINKIYKWDLNKPLKLQSGLLEASSVKGGGLIKKSIIGSIVEVRYRKGGERIRPQNQNITKKVKKIFQEKNVLPWCRDKFPLIYINNKLAAIPGVCISEDFYANHNDDAWHIKWTAYNKALDASS